MAGQNRSDSSQQLATKRNRAEARRCPQCHRGSALLTVPDDAWFHVECRWDDCDYGYMKCLDCHEEAERCDCW